MLTHVSWFIRVGPRGLPLCQKLRPGPGSLLLVSVAADRLQVALASFDNGNEHALDRFAHFYISFVLLAHLLRQKLLFSSSYSGLVRRLVDAPPLLRGIISERHFLPRLVCPHFFHRKLGARDVPSFDPYVLLDGCPQIPMLTR
jgi:hypothetical protein